MATVLNSNDIRINNTRKIIYALRNSPPMTKKDLSEKLRLSLPTIASIATELEEKGYIADCGRTDSSVGRKPSLISLNSAACYAVGVHITTHFGEIAIVSFGGEIIARQIFRKAFTGTETYWKEISSEIDTMLAEKGIDPERVCGIRIAVPYILFPLFWEQANLQDKPEDMIDLESVPKLMPCEADLVPVAIAAGVPRYWYGKLDRDAAVVFLDRFIEGCILEKDANTGSISAKACLLGHMTLDYRGRECFCGKKGCFQEYCSAAIITDRINGLDTAHDVIGRFPKKKLIHLPGFFEAIEAGNEEYARLWDEYLDALANAVHNLRLLLNSDVIICGEMSEYVASYKAELVRKIKKIGMTKEDVDEYLHTSSLSRYDACVGAALSRIDSLVEKIGAG
ncbi:MAG: ROK family transcriptional regulator [Oscillospiraceae bacterium]|nr:ROK family transcriptional regulator [Oscillospiraceae bacterium]